MTTVVIQPSSDTTGYDTYINDKNTTTNYGTDTELSLGKNSTGVNTRTLIKFDLSSIPSNAIVSSVVMSFYVSDASGFTRGSNYNFAIRRLKRNWVESQATWNVYATGSSWGSAGADASTDIGEYLAVINFGQSQSGWEDWSLSTTEFTKLIDGTYPNYGFWFGNDVTLDTGTRYKYWSSGGTYKPKLTVTYTLPSYNLTVANATNATTSDNVSLTQHFSPLTLSSPINLLNSENVSLTQHQILSVQDSAHVTTSENVTTTYHPLTLSVDDAGHLVLEDQLPDLSCYDLSDLTDIDLDYLSALDIESCGGDLTLAYHPPALALSNTTHGTNSTSPTLAQNYGNLTVSDSSHSINSDNLELYAPALTFNLSLEDASNGITSEEASLTQHYGDLGVEDSSHITTSDSMTISATVPSYSLTVQDSAHTITSENISLTQHQTLVVNNTNQLLTSENITLTAHIPTYSLVVANGTHVLTSENVALTQHHLLAVDNSSNVLTSENITI